MVQRKDPNKKPKNKNSFDQEDGEEETTKQRSRGRGGGGAMNRTGKNPTPAMTPPPTAKNSLPNYMKATSSSDAKKGRRREEVTPGSNTSSTTSGSRSNSKRKVIRVSKGKVLFAKLHANRATCSSTMKDSKFPNALDLAPGATEANGTSVLRVCPYTYCSLNGHVHEPCMPLKNFLASRRRLIKTQQSMKLKGVSPFRKKSSSTSPCKDDKEGGGISRMASGVKITPLIEEVVNDFFVEIYTSPRVELKDSEKVLAKDCGGRERVSSDMSCSDVSVGEMDAMMKRLEYVIFDRWCGDGEEKKSKDLDVCGEVESKLEAVKGSGVDLMENFHVFRDNRSDSSECSDGIPDDSVELSGMNYQGYISAEESGDVDDDKDDILDDERKEEIDEEQEEKDQESILDIVCEMEISEEQEAKDEENILDVGCEEETSAEQEAKDEENIPDVGCKEEPSAEQEANDTENLSDVVGCKLETSEEQEPKDEENIPNVSCEEEASAEEAREENISDVDCKVVISQEQGAKDEENIPDVGCEEEPSVEQEANDTENILDVGCGDVDADKDDILDDECKEEIDEEQEEKDEESTPDIGCEMEISEEQDAKDEENTPDIGCEEETSAEQEANDGENFSDVVGCKLEISEEQEAKDEENIPDVGCEEEASAEQEAREENISDVDCKVVISQEQEAKDEENMSNAVCKVDSSKEQAIDEESNVSDVGCELEISEETISVVGCQEDFSEEITSNVVSEGEVSELVCSNAIHTLNIEIQKQRMEDNAIEQDDNTADGGDDARKELEIRTCKLKDATEECGVAQETDNFSSTVQLREYEGNCDTSEDHGKSRINLPAEDSDVEESSIDDMCSAFSGMSLKGDVCFDPTEAAGCQRKRLIIARRRRTPEELEYMRGFNPRAPNFLPVELDPEAEKVDLRHQMMEERKNAEEWMIDYALRRAVNNLAPARKKKVELLVQAFETVLPPPASEKSMHDDDKKSFTPTRPIQACN